MTISTPLSNRARARRSGSLGAVRPRPGSGSRTPPRPISPRPKSSIPPWKIRCRTCSTTSRRPDPRSLPLHPVEQPEQAPVHLRRRQMVAAAMARQDPVEAVVEQAAERLDLCGPGEPAGVAEGSQILLVEAPGQGIAGKETMSVVEIGDAAPGMACHRDRQPAIIDSGSTFALEDIRGEGCGIA